MSHTPNDDKPTQLSPTLENSVITNMVVNFETKRLRENVKTLLDALGDTDVSNESPEYRRGFGYVVMLVMRSLSQ